MEKLLEGLVSGGPALIAVITLYILTLRSNKARPMDSKVASKLDRIIDKTDDLWDWHNVIDPSTGAKIWYIQKSLETSVEKLASAIENQTAVMQSMYMEMKDTRREIEYIMEKVNK